MVRYCPWCATVSCMRCVVQERSNPLVHDYADITPAWLYAIVRDHRGDIEEYPWRVRDLIQDPGRLGLTIQ